MALEQLRLDNLDQGRLWEQAQGALERTMKDLFERPDLKMPRQISITVDLTPGDLDSHGQLTNVVIGHGVKSSLPALKSKSIGMVDGRNVMVSMHQPDARQMDIADFTEEKDKRTAIGAQS